MRDLFDIQKNKELCLNIGCGFTHGPSWSSFDSSPTLIISKIPILGNAVLKIFGKSNWPSEVKIGNALSSTLVPPNSCDLIFFSHALEHLSYSEASIALSNIFVFLKPGGTLRIIVPDLESGINKYLSQRETNDPNAANDLIQALGIGMYSSRITLLSRLHEAFANSRHQWMYDSRSLELLLLDVGFSHVALSAYGSWSDNRFSEIESKERHDFSICFEANK